jgi:WD40 repeat protein
MHCRQSIIVSAVAGLLLGSASGDEPIPLADDGPRDYRAKYAIVVGVDDYSGGQGLGNLRYAANDAREFRKLLVEEFGYDDARILYLTDAKGELAGVVDGPPTVAAIRDAFEKWLPARGPGPDDSVLFFFAGHGLSDGYLAAADSRAAAKEGTCIPVSSLRAWLGSKNKKAVPCRHRLVLLDCCFSGTLFAFDQPLAARPVPEIPVEPQREERSAARTPGPPRGDAPGAGRVTGEIDYYLSAEAFVGMTAGLGDQPVADGTERDRHSLFTNALLQAMRERANSPRENHAFTFTELTAVVRPRVAAEVLRRNTLSDQIPMAGRLEPGEGDFLFQQSRDVEVPWERAEREARIATSRQLASLSVSERINHLDRSLLLAVEAIRTENTLEARDCLYEAISERPGLISFLHGDEAEAGRSVAFSPDGKTLAAGYSEVTGGAGGVVLWDVATRARVTHEPLRVHRGVRSVAFSPDGRTLAAGYGFGIDSGAVLWDVATRKRLDEGLLQVTEGPVTQISFSPSGETLAASINDGYGGSGGVVLWHVSTRRRLVEKPMAVREGAVSTLSFSPDGKTLAAGYRDLVGSGGVVFWDLALTRQRAGEPLHMDRRAVTGVAFRPDGRILAVAFNKGINGDGGVELWDVITRRRLVEEPLHVHEGAVESIAFTPDGKTLATGFSRGVVLWSVDQRERLINGSLAVNEGHVTSVAFSPDGRTLATGDDHGVELWDVVRRGSLVDESFLVEEGAPTSIAFSRDGKTLVVGYARGVGGGVISWDVPGRRPRVEASFPIGEGAVTSVAFSPDGRTLAVGFSYAEVTGGIVLWDVSARRRLVEKALIVGEGAVTSVAFSPDGKTLATGFSTFRSSGGGFVLWDLEKRARVRAVTAPGAENAITSIAFVRDGKTLATGSKRGVSLWDLVLLKRLVEQTLPVHRDSATSIAFGRRGEILAAGYSSGSRGWGDLWEGGVVFWEKNLSKKLVDQSLDVHEGRIDNISFDPEGGILAAGFSCGKDSNVVLWDVATRQRLIHKALRMDRGNTSFADSVVTFSPDSRILAVAHQFISTVRRGAVVLWDIDLDSWRGRAGQIANRNFTGAEWRQYFPGTPYRPTFVNLSIPPEAALSTPPGTPTQDMRRMPMTGAESPTEDPRHLAPGFGGIRRPR